MGPMEFKKPVEIAALKFEYSQEGNKALSEFCGDKLRSFGKYRTAEAKGWAVIGTLEDGGDHAPQVQHVALSATRGVRAAIPSGMLLVKCSRFPKTTLVTLAVS